MDFRVRQRTNLRGMILLALLLVGAGCGKHDEPPAAERAAPQRSAQRQPARQQGVSGAVTPEPKKIAGIVGAQIASVRKQTNGRSTTDHFSDFRQAFGPVFRMMKKEGQGDAFLRELKAVAAPEDFAYVQLWLLREKDDPNYTAEAERYLQAHRDDSLAADVMRIYADRKDEKAFLALGERYAKGDSRQLLEYSEIARNANWEPMKVSFAKQTLAQKDLPFAPAYRCATFLVEAKEYAAAGEALARLEKKAGKRYQREDLQLMRFRLAEQAGTFREEDIPALRTLSEQGMMPPVRREAKKLLERVSK